jgi:hypothetical protein
MCYISRMSSPVDTTLKVLGVLALVFIVAPLVIVGGVFAGGVSGLSLKALGILLVAVIALFLWLRCQTPEPPKNKTE